MDVQLDRTSISAGLIVYKLLTESQAVKETATKVFPVCITDEDAELPYVVFRFASFNPEQVKPDGGPDDCNLIADCLGNGYEEAVNLAEMVRAALENAECSISGLTLSGCVMTDREEFWEADAYVERLVFSLTV